MQIHICIMIPTLTYHRDIEPHIVYSLDPNCMWWCRSILQSSTFGLSYRCRCIAKLSQMNLCDRKHYRNHRIHLWFDRYYQNKCNRIAIQSVWNGKIVIKIEYKAKHNNRIHSPIRTKMQWMQWETRCRWANASRLWHNRRPISKWINWFFLSFAALHSKLE